MIPLQGILFDFDGTLADTMEGHYLAWRAALGEHGVPLEPSQYYPLEGMGQAQVAERLLRHRTEVDRQALIEKKKRHFVANHETKFYPGVEPLILALRQRKVPIGIVTAGPLDQLRGSVEARFLDQFDVLITGDRLRIGKPDPEPYLLGAKELHLRPSECLAIENAPLGVESAKCAGLYCIALCSTVPASELSAADEVLPRFADLDRARAMQGLLGLPASSTS